MSYINYKKDELTKLRVEDLRQTEINTSFENKTDMIVDWLANCINASDYSNCLLPTKSEFAYSLGVSLGTIQNVFKRLEDMHYIFLKQRIGAIVRDKNESGQEIRKHTSKVDAAVEEIKRYILDNGLSVGVEIMSARKFAKELGLPLNTVSMAIKKMVTDEILSDCDGVIIVNRNEFEVQDKINQETLVGKVKTDLMKYISNTFKPGQKIPSHVQLADRFKVSLKTIHSAIKLLEKDDVLMTRRGSYGTIVTNPEFHSQYEGRREMSIFAPARETAYYHYEKVVNKIKRMIVDEYGIGSKLPTILEFSQMMDLNPNTIRKALNQLSKEGIVRFARGRYGGIFVIDIPDIEESSFKWLAVNPQYTNSEL